jgi:hypothetical protein
MLNPFREVNWSPGPAERRSFARSLMIGFPCVSALLLIVRRLHSGHWHFELSLWIATIGLALGIALLLLPTIARPFYVAWYALACTIGFIVSNVLLATVYLVFFSFTGLLLRMAGHKPIRRSVDRSATSYWNDAGRPPESRRYFRQF